MCAQALPVTERCAGWRLEAPSRDRHQALLRGREPVDDSAPESALADLSCARDEHDAGVRQRLEYPRTSVTGGR
jgi:hypothetical protein